MTQDLGSESNQTQPHVKKIFLHFEKAVNLIFTLIYI